jgi:hypothetical protein
MKRLKNQFLMAVALAVSGSRLAFGHGLLPIVVGVQNGTLSVSGGTNSPNGYATNVFADPDEQAPLLPLPTNSSLLFTGLPAFKLNGLAVNSGLSLEAIPRRQPGGSATPRWLWYWNASTQTVAVEPHDPLAEVITDFDGEIGITQFGSPASTSVQLAAPTASDLSGHADLIRILLDNSPPADSGVYGFFARVTSPSYGSSAPFLIAMSLGVGDPAVFEQGAQAINVASGLAGDFNFSGGVDGADFLLWQRSAGASGTGLAADASLNGVVDAADLTIWRQQFGRPTASVTVAAAVPEPAAWASLSAEALLLTHALLRTFGRATRIKTGCRG